MADPFAGFEGYTKPTFTQVPDQFFDDHLRHLSCTELRVMLVLFRQTLGWKRDSHSISVPEIASRSGAGDSTVWRAVRSLESKGLVSVTRRTTKAGDPAANRYTIRWSRNERAANQGRSQNGRTVSQDREDGPAGSGGHENRDVEDRQTTKREGPRASADGREECRKVLREKGLLRE